MSLVHSLPPCAAPAARRTEPAPLCVEDAAHLALQVTRAQRQRDDLLRELNFAVAHAAPSYATAGHAERVSKLYGIAKP